MSKRGNKNNLCPECEGTGYLNQVECWLCLGSKLYFDQDKFEKTWEQQEKY